MSSSCERKRAAQCGSQKEDFRRRVNEGYSRIRNSRRVHDFRPEGEQQRDGNSRAYSPARTCRHPNANNADYCRHHMTSDYHSWSSRVRHRSVK